MVSVPCTITITQKTLTYSLSPACKRTGRVYRLWRQIPEKLSTSGELHVDHPKIQSRKRSAGIRTCKKQFTFNCHRLTSERRQLVYPRPCELILQNWTTHPARSRHRGADWRQHWHSRVPKRGRRLRLTYNKHSFTTWTNFNYTQTAGGVKKKKVTHVTKSTQRNELLVPQFLRWYWSGNTEQVQLSPADKYHQHSLTQHFTSSKMNPQQSSLKKQQFSILWMD